MFADTFAILRKWITAVTDNTVRDLGNALHDGNEGIRSNIVNFLIATMALGMSFHLDSRIILKYLQGTFGIRYLTMRLLPHLDVEQTMKGPTSQSAWPIFSLLP